MSYGAYRKSEAGLIPLRCPDPPARHVEREDITVAYVTCIRHPQDKDVSSTQITR